MKLSRLLIYFLVLGLFACTGQPKKEYTYKHLLVNGLTDNVHLVHAGDISGNNKDELILAADSSVYIYEVTKDTTHLIYSNTFEQQVLQMVTGDVDNDKKNELVIACGYRGYKDSGVEILLIENVRNEWRLTSIFTRESPRPQPLYLDIADIDNDGKNEIIASYYESKYMVETVTITDSPDGWHSDVILLERMATARDIGILSGKDKNSMVVGRVYGDKLGDDGDAYIIEGKQKIKLPVYRGVRSAIKIGDVDNDGVNEIYVGDGWHSNYGKMARARLGMIKFDGNNYYYDLIEDIKGEVEVSQIEISDINGNGRNELVVRGSESFRIYKFVDNQWKVFTDTSIINNQFTIGDITGDKRPEVIISGIRYRNDKGMQVISFDNPVFNDKLGKEVLTETTDPDSLIGDPAPELRMDRWLNSDALLIKQLQGKVIVLDYWATWCAPCIKTFPELRALYEKYQDNGLVIIGITRVDNTQNEKTIEDFVVKEDFPYPVGISEESFNYLSYGVGGIPHVVMIDKNGIVREYLVGVQEEGTLEKEIIKLLNE